MKIPALRTISLILTMIFAGITAGAQSVEDLRGKPAPAWSLKAPDGKTVNLTDFKGQIVLLDFWATWCGPCKLAMPSIQKVAKTYSGRKVVVIGINAWEEDPKNAVAYMKAQKYDYKLVLGGDAVAANYHIEGIPTMIVINDKGVVAEVHVGYDPNLQKTLSGSLDRLIAAR